MLLLGCGLTSFQSHSGAFSLYTEGSASAVGNFAAGVAAEGRDASIGWFNPAGLVLLRKPEIVLGAVGVLPHVSLTGEAIFNQIEIDSNELLPPYVENFNNLNGAQNAVVPNLHVAIPVGDNFTYGLSIVSPLGLSTSWPQDSALRYAATLSELTVVDISPEMGGLIRVSKDGCQTKEMELPLTIAPAYYGNIVSILLFGVGTIGVIWDLGNHSYIKTDKVINVDLDCGKK